jgi:hypothetical protein
MERQGRKMTLSEFEFLLARRGVLLVGANFEGQGTTRCCLGCRLPDGARLHAYGETLESAAQSLLTRLDSLLAQKPMAQA